MNSLSIFFVLSIFAHFVFGYSKFPTGGKLSPEENQKRLDTCGMGRLDIVTQTTNQQTFHRMSWFQDGICLLTGICYGEPNKITIPVPIIPPIKATVPITTRGLTPRPTTLKHPTVKPTTTTTVKPAVTQTPKALTTITSTTTSTQPPTVPTTTVKATTVTTTPTTTTTVEPVITEPSGAFTAVTSTTTSTKPLPVPKTVAPVAPSTVGEAKSQVTTDPGEFLTLTAQVTTPTTAKASTNSDSMTVPTILPQNSTDEATPDSSVDSSAEDPPPNDPVTYEPPLALGIDFSLGPEQTEPSIDYEEYEERKKHMDDDDQDYKNFWMDETGNGGRKMELLLVLAGVFMGI
ncbi:hypothetical protein CAEBREN_23733 [Caenorhabditis brenneri]|uniref:Uncharacterized protein n=1 Tax=Caenorhabditis brenneri TaxID=135651 RepID=G0MJ32_CAEBE|nr:hypothetical protein CAEBREN_23733 [Caenorhabditis brenneri]